MKQRNKLLCLVAAAALCLGLAACGARASTEPAVAPYDMTEDQEELLSLLGLTDKAMVFSFQGPEEAAELTAHTYVLEDGAWVENGGVSMTRDTAEAGPFQGEFALVYREDRSMELYLHHQGGVVSFASEPVAFPGETLASLRAACRKAPLPRWGRKSPWRCLWKTAAPLCSPWGRRCTSPRRKPPGTTWYRW